jgi:hypothetical protein
MYHFHRPSVFTPLICLVTYLFGVSDGLSFIYFCELYYTLSLPIDGDILLHVGLATANNDLPLNKIEVFYVPKGTLVTLRPGIWHCVPFAYETDYVNALIVLAERTYAKDCIYYTLTDEDKIGIEIK